MRLNLSLLLCLLVVALAATQNGVVQAKTLVRGSHPQQQQQQKVVRLLKKDKNADVPEGVLAAEAAPEDEDDQDEEDDEVQDEKEDKNAPDDDEEEGIDTPIEGGLEADETTLGPDEEGAVTTAPVEGETDSGMETMAPTEAAGPETVTLTPFTLYVEGGEITEDELNLEAYLEAALGATDVELMIVNPEQEEEVVNSTRFLRQLERFLQQSVFYYEGTATFEGAAPDDVHDQVTAALSDSEALTAHVNLPNITVTASPNTNPDGSVAVVAGAESGVTTSDSSDDGLTTTGLAIVIVAASIGGISLLIIVLVGATGPSGSTAQLK